MKTRIKLPTKEKPQGYDLNGKHYTAKPITFRLRGESLDLVSEFRVFAKEYTKDVIAEYKLHPLPNASAYPLKEEDPAYVQAKLEHEIVSQEYMIRIGEAMMHYLLKEDNLKMVFYTFLVEDTIDINLDTQDDAEFKRILEFAAKVFSDFFSLSKSIVS